MIKKEILTKKPDETKKLGEKLGKKIKQTEESFFLALEGNMGGGKTVFLKGLAEGLGIKGDVFSPTFVIYKKYKISKKRNFYHFDAYRVQEEDLKKLGFFDILSEKNSVVAAEWSENIKKITPPQKIKIVFLFVDKEKRKLIVEGNSGIITGVFS
jgi:tRNA threonylcarbamoyladenosine biosynthesis protein TsaE